MDLKGRVRPLMILVKEEDKATKTTSGIIIPDIAQEAEMKGTVTHIGEGTRDIPMCVKPGEKILFHHKAGQKLKVDGEEYRLMSQNDIFFIYE